MMDEERALIVRQVMQIRAALIAVFGLHYRRYQRRMLWAITDIAEAQIATLIRIVEEMAATRRPRRRIWMHVRCNQFWEIVVPNFTPHDWLERFRVTKPTVDYVCGVLRVHLEPREAFLISRPPISAEKQVAVTLFYLASCCEFRTVGDIFGLHKTSIWRCVHRVVNAINNVLLPIWIKMPTEAECQLIAEAFEEKSHIPQIIGCIDGSHIPVRAPSNGYRDYVNRKGWTSIILQAVVDNKYLFRNINCCTPGASHDALVFRSSGLFEHSEDLIPQVSKNINGIEIPYMVVGDPAYPLLPWLLKGYTRMRPLTPFEDSFNVYLNSARVAVEIAFGRLKARCQTVQKRIDLHHNFAPSVIAACCTLHNILETRENYMNAMWLSELRDTERQFEQPDEYEEDHPEVGLIRETLKDLVANFPLRRSYKR